MFYLIIDSYHTSGRPKNYWIVEAESPPEPREGSEEQVFGPFESHEEAEMAEVALIEVDLDTGIEHWRR